MRCGMTNDEIFRIIIYGAWIVAIVFLLVIVKAYEDLNEMQKPLVKEMIQCVKSIKRRHLCK
jgi:hypothetical protein